MGLRPLRDSTQRVSGKVILAIEDDDHQYLIIKIALRQVDDTVQLLRARSGEEALQQLRQATKLPDLIFLDLRLPGLNGEQLLSMLQGDTTFSQMPVVVLAAQDEPYRMERCLRMGAKAYFVKPWEFPQLMKDIQASLEFAVRI